MQNIWLVLLSISEAVAMVLAARLLLHYFQLESYQFRGYFKTILRQWKRAFAFGLILTLVYFVFIYLIGLLAVFVSIGVNHWIPELAAILIFALIPVILGIIMHRYARNLPQKKKFALTARMKRLYVALVLACAIAVILNRCGSEWFHEAYLNSENLTYARLSLVLEYIRPSLFLPFIVALAGLLALPIERLIFHLYFRDAEKKLLENPRLIRIGITGSYGKTSTKFILAEILSQKYNVLATPASFNTPMGVTRIIRERLTPAHQVFIGEMGARHVGEIKELSRLVHPTIGILTAVGPQHLDTFKTIERIEKTKYELIDALPGDGLSVFLNDDGIVTRLYEKTSKPKMLAGKEGADAWASDVSVSPQGSHFTLHLGDWEPFECTTPLLGRHNIGNILAACCVAKHLNLNREQIRRGIQQLKPVEHRLQLLKTAGGVTVIDDAFNTNPTSSKEALKVLSSFPGRRVIVTPGMVELGAEEARYNEEFGQAMADAVDVAVLVGKRHTEPIQKGLKEKGFPPENIHTVASLDEAIQVVNGILKPGDVVMYENDLPDHYNES
ncbi:MAG: UDP-N-acetylmuramoyl-tripeptide--D-alanyl-D-alanine ligase [Clostridia bacterium]|nr:UDP-N-acetylmuramoyl-tripeptide--D-alanyl-D-alanine ligase [Clostridia bacterium]